MPKVKITSKGQITLPKSLRERLDISEGDYLDVFENNGSIVLRPAILKESKDAVLTYLASLGGKEPDLEKARQILKKVPFSVSDRVAELREDD